MGHPSPQPPGEHYQIAPCYQCLGSFCALSLAVLGDWVLVACGVAWKVFAFVWEEGMGDECLVHAACPSRYSARVGQNWNWAVSGGDEDVGNENDEDVGDVGNEDGCECEHEGPARANANASVNPNESENPNVSENRNPSVNVNANVHAHAYANVDVGGTPCS